MTQNSIQGHWYPSGSALQLEASLHIDADSYVLKINNGAELFGQINQLKISERLGHVERKITLRDGSTFASVDNQSIDRLLPHNQSKMTSLLHAMESRMTWVLCVFIVTIAFVFSFFRWGVPWVSTQVAYALPDKANQVISSHAMGFLDKYFFEPSALSVERKNQIRAHFKKKVLPLEGGDSGIAYSLHFRSWDENGKGIANAFALPSGDIVLTDRFVELSQNQNQIDAVILHEMGHVVFRHGLRSVISTTLLATITMLAVGDGSGFSDLGVGVGSLLVNSHYSRHYESEADLYSFKKMLENGIDPNAFAQIMDLMMKDVKKIDKKSLKKDQDIVKDKTEQRNSEKSILNYLSSHPSSEQRIEQARQFSLCFQQGLKECELKNTQ